MGRIRFVWIGFVFAQQLVATEIDLGERRFQVPEGFTIERVAGPPLVDRPITADFDEQGRLYVADSSGSNAPLQQQIKELPHRIVRLVDSDSDGTFDQSTVFAERMPFPEGCMWLDGSLYVAAPPSIWRLTDTDNDGIADQREEWFRGGSLGHCGNDLHGPYLGPDGWIYWCKGAWAQQTYDRENGTPFVTKAAHIFRAPANTPIDLAMGSIQTQWIEPVMTGGMDNPVDVAFTPNGERIFTTTFLVNPGGGLRDGLIHAIYGGVYGKPKMDSLDSHVRTGPLMPPLCHLGAAAPCGLTCLQSDNWGREFQGNLFACLFNMRKVTRHPLVQKDATFTAIAEDFVVSDHVDFHPTDVLEDADGSLLIVDTGGWYKLCCPTSQMEKPDVFGAIYRVRPTTVNSTVDHRGRQLKFQTATNAELVNWLGDRRFAVQRQATEQLVKRIATDARAVEGLRSMLLPTKPAANAVLRRNAIWTLSRATGRNARSAVRLGLQDADATNRQVAAHAISLNRDQDAANDLLELLERDHDPHTQRVVVEALGRIKASKSVASILSMASQATSREVEHSLTFALIEIGSIEPLREAITQLDPKVKRLACIALDQLPGQLLLPSQVVPLLNEPDAPLREAAEWIIERHPEWGKELVEHFREQLARPLDESKQTELVHRLALFGTDEPVSQLLIEKLSDRQLETSVKSLVVRAMSQTNQSACPESWRSAILTELNGLSATDPLANGLVSILHRWPQKGSSTKIDHGQLIKLAADPGANAELRLLCLAAYPGTLPAQQSALEHLVAASLSREQPVSLRAMALEVLGKITWSPNQWKTLATATLTLSPVDIESFWKVCEKIEDADALNTVLHSLSHAAARSALPPELVKSKLDKVPDNIRPAVQRLFEQLLTERAAQQSRIDELLLTLPAGDERRGQLVFRSQKTACVACHAIGYSGGKLGPDLTAIGKVRQKVDLLESIVFPNASLVRSYEPMAVLTRDGKTYNGLVVEENAETLTLATGADQLARIPMDEIEERKASAVSIMPSGLDRQISSQELADLLAFLQARRG